MSFSAMRAASVCWLLLMSLSSAAHLPAVYGRDYLLVDGKPAVQSEHCSPPAAPGVPVEEPLLHRLDELEAESGPYSVALAEPLADLGRHYRDSGDFDEAARAFNRALHLMRVNGGLNGRGQLDLLEELAETFRQQGDLVSLDQVQTRKYRVYRQDPGADKTAGIQAALEYLSWQRQAFDSGIDGSNLQRLLETYLLNRQLLDELDSAGLAGGSDYRRLAFSQLANLYLIMGAELVDTGGAMLMSGSLQPSQSGSESYVRQRIGRMQLGGLGEGRKLLESLIEQSTPADARARASLRLALGDWLQWNGEVRSAGREYATVVRLLQEQGETDLLQEWLGEPRELPDARLFQPFDPGLLSELSGHFTASFVVNSKGIVRDLELTGDDSRGVSRLSRMVSGTHFRPRYVSGEAEESRAERRHYRLVGRSGAAAARTGCIAGLM